jgi:hypothetical protein
MGFELSDTSFQAGEGIARVWPPGKSKRLGEAIVYFMCYLQRLSGRVGGAYNNVCWPSVASRLLYSAVSEDGFGFATVIAPRAASDPVIQIVRLLSSYTSGCSLHTFLGLLDL